MQDRISKEMKLSAAKDIVANYVRGNESLSPDDVCDMLKKVYGTIEEIVPDPEGHRIGLA